MNYQIFDNIVVVDNCSTDNSYEILKQYENDKIKVLKSSYNGGYGYGNNMGIKYSYENLGSNYILIANPDVEFEEECILKLRDFLRENRDVAVCSAIPKKPNGSIQKIVAWRIPTLRQYVLSASNIYNRFFNTMYYNDSYFSNYVTYCDVDCVAGSLIMVNAKLMIENGMYDEEIFLYGEETVLGIKLKKKNLRTVLLTNQYYIHHHSVSINKSIPSNIDKQRILLNSKIIVLKKYYNIPSFQLKLVKLFFKITLVELIILQFLKYLFQRKR